MASASNSTSLGNNYTLQAYFNETSTNTSGNYSTIYIEAKLSSGNTRWSSSYNSYIRIYWHDNKNNSDVLVASTAINSCSTYSSYYANGNITVYHNSDGNLSGYAYAYFEKGGTSSYAPSSGGVTTSWTALTYIPRWATMTSADNFDDENNPSFTFTNAGNATDLNVWLEPNPNGNHYATRTLTISSGTYTWDLTDEEKDQLRKECVKNSCTMRVGLYSTISGTQGSSYKDVTYTIINANPTLADEDITTEETNEDVIDIMSGTTDTYVENISIPKITAVPVALKQSTISGVTFTYGGTSTIVSASPYETTFTASDSSFNILVTDSRGNSVSAIKNVTILPYKKISKNKINIYRDNPTSSDIIMELDFTYYSGTYNNTTNAPVVKYKMDDEEYIDISDLAVVDDENHKITVNTTLEGKLDYQKSGNFSVYVEDIFSNDGENNINVTRGIPTTEWGENDFQVNGTLYLADENGDNKKAITGGGDALPVGAIVHYEGDTVPDGYVEYEPIFKFQKFEKAVYIGANAMASTAMGTFTTPDGYTNLCVVPIENGYGDQWIVSYCFYGGNNVYAMIHSQYGAGLSSYLKCYVVFVKTSEFSDMLIS